MFFIFGGTFRKRRHDAACLCNARVVVLQKTSAIVQLVLFFSRSQNHKSCGPFCLISIPFSCGLAGLDGPRPVIAHWLGARRRFEIRGAQLDGGGGNGACGQRSLLKNDWLTEVIGICERCYWMRRECLRFWDDEGELNYFEVWNTFSFENRKKNSNEGQAESKRSERQIPS